MLFTICRHCPQIWKKQSFPPLPTKQCCPAYQVTSGNHWLGGWRRVRKVFFLFFFKTLPTADNSYIRFVASSSHFHAFHVRLRKERRLEREMFILLRSVTFVIRNQTFPQTNNRWYLQNFSHTSLASPLDP